MGAKPATQVASLTDRKSWVLHYANGTIIDPAAISYPKEPTPSYPFTASPGPQTPVSAGKSSTRCRARPVLLPLRTRRQELGSALTFPIS